jgi:excisionase family DNA binding protein
MTARDTTDLTPGELRTLLQQPPDPGSNKAARAETQRRPQPTPPPELLLTPAEAAAIFRVGTETIRAWASAGKLTCIHTPGGHRRYRAAEVYALRDAPLLPRMTGEPRQPPRDRRRSYATIHPLTIEIHRPPPSRLHAPTRAGAISAWGLR